MVNEKIFSDFEVKETSILFKGDSKAETIGCVGSLEESLNVITRTKKCEGVVVKSRTKSDGSGELKLSLHMKYDVYLKTFAMVLENLKTGISAYGTNNTHPYFCLTAKVLDEDDNVKYIAYPNCTASTGIARKIENGATEVAEMELTISVSADEFGNVKYEGLEENISDESVKSAWLTNFTPELVQAN